MTNPHASPTDAQRIAAKGHPITLADGREVRVRYGLRGLAELERRFGGLKQVAETLQEAMHIAEGRGRAFRPIFDLLACGLMSENLSEEELDELLDPAALEKYLGAVAVAFTEAMPSGKVRTTVEVPGPVLVEPSTDPQVRALVDAATSTTTDGSTGPGSTGSEPSPLGGPTSSGGT